MRSVIPLLVLAACNCTANVDATLGAQGCEAEEGEASTATLRTGTLVVDNQIQNGTEAPGSSRIALFSKLNNDTTTQVWIDSIDSDHVGQPGHNQLSSLVIRNSIDFDTTDDPGVARGIEISVECTASTGLGCTPTAAQLNALNGYAIYSQQGSMRVFGDVDLGPGAVRLGDNVRAIMMSDDGANTPRIVIGWPSGSPPSPDGSQLFLKNNIAGVSVAGTRLALDTTVQSGIRGGFRISRGAGGGLAGNDSGIAVSGGTGFPFLNSAANQFNVYDELGQGIVFGANTGYTPMWKMTPKDHFVNANVSDSGSTPRIPAKSASCDTGGSSSIVGSDFVVRWKMGASATACDITFIQPYTTQIPTCVVTGEAGAGVPTYTTALDKISVSVGVAGATYNAWCFGHLGSQ